VAIVVAWGDRDKPVPAEHALKPMPQCGCRQRRDSVHQNVQQDSIKMNDSVALVVEDDVITSSTYGRVLEKLGYEVHVVHSLEQAFETWPSILPGIVLLDLGLPDGSGLDLLR